jgi:hypothetical protein
MDLDVRSYLLDLSSFATLEEKTNREENNGGF